MTRYSCQIFFKFEHSLQIFEKFEYKISSKSVQCEPSCSTRKDGRKNVTKQIVAFRNFAIAPKI
jgi:hypothetical protein